MNQCKKCGAYLDPGESCDCDKSATEKLNRRKVWEVLQDIKKYATSTVGARIVRSVGLDHFFRARKRAGWLTGRLHGMLQKIRQKDFLNRR